MKLNVYMGNVKAGSLDIASNEPFYGFTYDGEYLTSPEARLLSLSLPMVESRYPGAQAQPYFEGLLPEGESRNAIARRLGIPRTSSVKLLRVLGRGCVGDVSIIEEGDGTEPNSSQGYVHGTQTLLPLDGGIFSIAENPHKIIPRLQEDMRLSLAGGQKKIALYHKHGDPMQEGWYVPTLGFPTTHIIKPGILETHYPGITLNEYLCLHAATVCGISTVDAEIIFPEKPVIVIRRYDRLTGGKLENDLNAVSRIHQEDCCQACGVKSDMKYEHNGGPGFKQIRDLLVKHCKHPVDDVVMLMKWGIFNYLIGNCDAHAKNLSLLHNTDGTVSLAPAYDMISTTVYDGRYGAKLSRNLGMRIGMHENIDRVTKDDFTAFAADVHMRLRLIKSFGEELTQKLPYAFYDASLAANREGFRDAREMAGRILEGCTQRAMNLP